ncbi:MAG TPA: hypothetical protein VFJ74_17390 [Gemmatimonadaceae bacterium]|nr:hypothetical protein [Gemmatimonadaceae bacterium]
MPSDSLSRPEGAERVQRALDAIAARRAGFRASVEAAQEQARAFLGAHAPRADARARDTALELGLFAGGRIDSARFAAVVAAPRVLSPDEETVIRRCAEVMDEVLAQGDGLFVCELPSGGDLHAAVDAALAETGRAFGAALVFQAVKSGGYRPEQLGALRAFPFRRWSRGERLLAPPLLVAADGADLHAGALAEYLDGRQKIVVVLRGAVTPAPMARLVGPRTYVAQLSDADANSGGLARAMEFDGPAAVALVPETAARFVHDPAAGATLAQRLTIVALPKDSPRAAVGGHSLAQQREELAQLTELANLAVLVGSRTVEAAPASASAQVVVPPGATPNVPPALTADHLPLTTAATDDAAVTALTTWLLAQAGLGSVDGIAAAAGGAKS